MGVDKKDLIKALNTNAKELQQSIDLHCCLMNSILEGQVSEHSLQPLLEMWPKRSREIRLEKALKEAINELEESRKAFKSKRLEMLRKKLTQELIDAD